MPGLYDMFADGGPAPKKPVPGLFESLVPPKSADATEAGSSKRASDQPASEPEAKKARQSSPAGASSEQQAQAAVQQVHVTTLNAAYSEDKGSRTAMEDVAVIKLDGRAPDAAESSLRLSFFGIFDGHGGRQVAQHAAEHLHSTVMAAGLAAEAAKAAPPDSDQGNLPSAKACKAAITVGFKSLDESILAKCAAEGWSDGATAVAAWVVGELVLVANVGDARCVLARRPPAAAAANGAAGGGSSTGGAAQSSGSGAARQGAGAAAGQPPPSSGAQHPSRVTPSSGNGSSSSGAKLPGSAAKLAAGQQAAAAAAGQPSAGQPPEAFKAITLTREHKAIFPVERQRIERAGGYVSGDGRLGGRIEVSRAFGDRQFKRQGMSAVPDIQAFQISARDAFLLLGCDGFFGVFPPQDAVDFASKEMAKGYDVKQTCNRLIYEAIRERGCKDNCTVMMIKLGD